MVPDVEWHVDKYEYTILLRKQGSEVNRPCLIDGATILQYRPVVMERAKDFLKGFLWKVTGGRVVLFHGIAGVWGQSRQKNMSMLTCEKLQKGKI